MYGVLSQARTSIILQHFLLNILLLKLFMKNKLDFKELSDWRKFENLVESYFRLLKEEENNVIDVEVRASGIGSDGGRDILVVFRVTDSVLPFERKWVVQCKFHEKTISKSDLADANIPSLIHQYGADGYLLICKGDVSSRVTEMFENLNDKCKFKYKYEIWQGEGFKSRLLFKRSLHKQYFPEYDEFLQTKEGTN